jgi:hypothetical protein
MKKPIFMGSTKIDPLKTVSEIMAVLVASGARQIASDYDAAGKVCGLRFVIEAQGKQLAFALPVRTDALLKHLRNDRAQAERVAWRQLLRWVQAQLAMIEVGMVRAEEVYTPYLLQADGRTLYEAMWQSKFKALETGKGLN